jgi:hypothetical protein
MTDTEIQVEKVSPAGTDGDLNGHFNVKGIVDNKLQIVGWAFARYGYVSAIEVKSQGMMVANTVPRLRRPDVGEAFPAVDAAGTSGFQLVIEAQGEGRSTLEIEAVLSDGARLPLGSIAVCVGKRA